MGELTAKIQSVKNGYVITIEHGDEIVYQEDAEDEHEAFADFLRSLREELGPSDRKDSPKRVYIKVLPGHDHEDYERLVKESFL